MSKRNLIEPPSGGPPPKVSVLLPTYNYARFLDEAISSVIPQDLPDIELIVSDDASTDGSDEVVAEFARRDSRIRFMRQPERLGLVANFNWCLGQARGKYVKFVFGDDKLARPDALSRLVKMLEHDPRCVLASSAANIINERSELVRVRDYFGRDLMEDGGETCRRCLLRGSNEIGEPSLFLFRRSCAGTGFDPSYRHWVDAELAFRILEQGRFVYCAEPLAAFREHPAQQTGLDRQEQLHLTEYYRLLVQYADRPWLGREAARKRLFEELYRSRKAPGLPGPAMKVLDQAIEQLGREGHSGFLLRRKLIRPFTKLYHSAAKRLPGDHSLPTDSRR